MIHILIISPHFPPTNAADMQRVRLVLPYLCKAGAEAVVLAIDPEQVAAPLDEWLQAGLPENVSVHRVKALGLLWGRISGLGTLGFRALRALKKAGDSLLRTGDIDLVYFSTTQFGVHILGPHWKRKYGIPFVMDYQDPWVSDYYRNHPEVPPPGGRFKYGIADWLNRRNEPRVLRECCGITSVSAAYPRQLRKRYPWLHVIDSGPRPPTSDPRPPTSPSQLLSTVLPFPGDCRDFDRVRQENISQRVFDPHDGKRHWVYVGRGGEDMAFAVRALFSALAALRPLTSDIRLHFIGTSYAAAGAGRPTIEPLAAEFGLRQQVEEYPDRIPYSEALRCLLDAEALFVPGSDDPAYTASKIYPYLLTGKPLLAIFHESSSVTSLIREAGGGIVVPFGGKETTEQLGRRVLETAFNASGYLQTVALNQEGFAPYLADAQARRLVEFFEQCLANEGEMERRIR